MLFGGLYDRGLIENRPRIKQTKRNVTDLIRDNPSNQRNQWSIFDLDLLWITNSKN